MTGRGAGEGSTSVEVELGEADAPEVEVRLTTAARDLVCAWRFRGTRAGPARLEVDWLKEPCPELRMSAEGEELASECLERRPDTIVRPEMELAVGGAGRVLPVRVTQAAALERYYGTESHQDEYVVQHPFFLAFHEARLRVLGRLFRAIQPGSRVLDVGSGYSIFFLITTGWPFPVTCCDLDAAAMEKMKGLVPEWDWRVADAAALPFDDSSFDTLFAGEIIEHVGDPLAALAEWRRVLAPGGRLILTTPNSRRLLARANRAAMPVHPEHIEEFDPAGLRAVLRSAGFAVEKLTGIYLELGLNWYRHAGKRVDMLVSLAGDPRLKPLYRPFMGLGRLAPAFAYDLVAVCRSH